MADKDANPGANPLELQVARNTQTRLAWDGYQSHRDHVMQLLCKEAGSAETSKKRLMVLGAGNCNDLDLVQLLQVYREVHLVDLDREALESAVSRQQVTAHPHLHLHAPVNLLPDAGDPAAAALPKVEVVASICLISQLLEVSIAKQSKTLTDPRQLSETADQLVAQHLRGLGSLALAGGAVWLITDIVSSQTLPELAETSEAGLPGLLRQALQRGNFFLGLHPGRLQQGLAALRSALAIDSSEGGGGDGFSEVAVVGPWKWIMGPKAFAVVAMGIRLPAR